MCVCVSVCVCIWCCCPRMSAAASGGGAQAAQGSSTKMEPPAGVSVSSVPARQHHFAGKPVRFKETASGSPKSVSFKLKMPSFEERMEESSHRLEKVHESENSTDPSKGINYDESEFKKLADLGSGNFSEVYLARHLPTGEVFAIKSIRTKETMASITEVEVLSEPRFNVVKYFGHFMTNSSLNLVLEYMDAGSLDTLLPNSAPLPTEVLAAAAVQLCVALKDIHERPPRVIHRDIKPQNLLVNRRGEVKLSDFNTCRQIITSMDKGKTGVGTVWYMSPERIQGSVHSFPSDIWSFGLSLVELATGKVPFSGGDSDSTSGAGFFAVMNSIVFSPSPELDPTQFPPDFCDFVAQCLQKDPEQRMKASQLLEHPFCVNAPTQEWLCSWLEENLPPPKIIV